MYQREDGGLELILVRAMTSSLVEGTAARPFLPIHNFLHEPRRMDRFRRSNFARKTFSVRYGSSSGTDGIAAAAAAAAA